MIGVLYTPIGMKYEPIFDYPITSGMDLCFEYGVFSGHALI